MNTAKAETFIVDDDGVFPNSKLPVIHYRNAFDVERNRGAQWLEETFAKNNWTNAWRNGVYPFHHYHSTSHEVLGIFGGNARLQIGGDTNVTTIEVTKGDILILPAGVAHKNLESGHDFGVVGAYPNGRSWDLLRGNRGERPGADENIAQIPLPATDPLYGKAGSLGELWKKDK